MERKFKKKSFAEMIKDTVKKLTKDLPNGFTMQKAQRLAKKDYGKDTKLPNKVFNRIFNKAFKNALLGNSIRVVRDFEDGRHTLYNISLGSPKTPPTRIRLKRLRTNVRPVASSQESLTFSPVMRSYKKINKTSSQGKTEENKDLETATEKTSEK